MEPDEDICLCFHVSQRKVVNYLRRENPRVASLISECLGAGTGCGWCVPYLEKLQAMNARGELPRIEVTTEEYAAKRVEYKKTGMRSGEADGNENNGDDGDDVVRQAPEAEGG